ncbi:D-serine ammonia-lyase [uncultured Robinsoniella sp.]|uniref:D-serine ammonia-lyase n=1 Tax=uncultured Robinsoniella sp. TaxID=904190 RepID=UPI00374FA9BC
MMSIYETADLVRNTPVLNSIVKEKETVWINPDRIPFHLAEKDLELSMKDIDEAEERLKRFAPFIAKCFPETEDQGGIIESVLTPIPKMQKYINEQYHCTLTGKLLLKQDSHLAIAGSIKARGGIYEVLKHTEDLALQHGLISLQDSYEALASGKSRSFFGEFTIQVGSTGNLGMSIGIMSAAIGYNVIVHMSGDARQWKKELLRSHGVKVVEYESDYSEAVLNGRKRSDENPKSYFVDDENSRNLFLGYAVAAKRLMGQLKDQGISVDSDHPLFVYIPCGVGGAPGGVSFGLKQLFNDSVHCFFAEPAKAPCMLVGMATGLHQKICVQDIGLSGQTHADGLAVGRPSGFVGGIMKPLLSGIFTIGDAHLYDYMRSLLEREDIFLEPSACAAFTGPIHMNRYPETKKYLKENQLCDKMEQAVHVVWATGGSLVPEEVRKEYIKTYLEE